MSRFRAEVRIKPRPGLLDPEGKAIHHALDSLGFEGIDEARVGKVIDLGLEAESADIAHARAEEMCRKLLANPVTEDFEIEVRAAEAAAPEGDA